MNTWKIALLAFGGVVLAFVIYLCVDGFSIFRDPFTVVYAQHQPVPSADMDRTLPVAALQADLDFLRRTIEDVGVNPYLNTPREAFARDFLQVKAGIDRPLTRTEFFRRIVPLVHSLKDSHTSVFEDDIDAHYAGQGGRFFPLTVNLTPEGRILVDHDCSALGLRPGSEINAINGVGGPELLHGVLAFEKGLALYPRIRNAQERFHWRLWQAFGFTGPFQVAVGGRTLTVPGIPAEQIRRSAAPAANNPQAVEYRRIGPRTGLLTVRSFLLDPGDFYERVRRGFETVRGDGVTDLIIDVRGNGGGNEINGMILIDFFWDKPYRMSSRFLRKKSHQWVSFYWQLYKWWARPVMSFDVITAVNEEARAMFGSFRKAAFGVVDTAELPERPPQPNPLRFRGKTCVLIDHLDGSATVGFLGAVKDYHMAALIGEETGESPTGSGELYPFDLPNSRLFAYASTTLVVRPNGDLDMTRGVLPDTEINPTAEDLDKGVDTVLERAREMIAR